MLWLLFTAPDPGRRISPVGPGVKPHFCGVCRAATHTPGQGWNCPPAEQGRQPESKSGSGWALAIGKGAVRSLLPFGDSVWAVLPWEGRLVRLVPR